MSASSLKRKPPTRPTCGEVARRTIVPQFGDPKWIAKRDRDIRVARIAKLVPPRCSFHNRTMTRVADAETDSATSPVRFQCPVRTCINCEEVELGASQPPPDRRRR